VATAEDIRSDLTLEIDGDLSPEKFLSAARAFFGYVEEAGKGVATAVDRPIKWVVRVKEGSNLIGVEPTQQASIEVVKAVYARVQRGIEHLAAGDIDGSGLSEPALTHLRSLSELTSSSIEARFWIEKRPILVGPEIAETIREDWRVAYRDMGTIEGRLEAIQDNNRLELRINDYALRLKVKCFVSEDMLPVAFANFRRRVEVTGTIHYKKNGHPISIDADSIDLLPDDHELPSIEEMRGIFGTVA
jgi:hypothetical protein